MAWFEKVSGKRWLIPVLGLILVGAVVGAYYLLRPSADAQVQEHQMQTATVR